MKKKKYYKVVLNQEEIKKDTQRIIKIKYFTISITGKEWITNQKKMIEKTWEK